MDRLLTLRVALPSVAVLVAASFVLPAQASTAIALLGIVGFIVLTGRAFLEYRREWVSAGFSRSGLGMIAGMSAGFWFLALMLIDRLIHGQATSLGVNAVMLTPAAWFAGMVCHMKTRRPYDWSDGLIDALSALAAVVLLRWQWLVLDGASANTMAIQLAPFVALFFLGTVGSHNMRLEKDPRQNRVMLRTLGGCVPPLIASLLLSDTMTDPQPSPLAFSFLLVHSYLAFAGAAHSSFLSQLEPEPGNNRVANPLRVAGPVAALLTTPLMFGLFVVRHEVPTIPVGLACMGMICLALWRGAGLLREREANRRQLAAEQRFRALVEHSQDVITVLDENNRIAFATGGVERMLGVQAKDLIGLPISKFVSEHDAELMTRARATLGPKQTWMVERDIKVHHADGTIRWVSASLTNHVDTPGIGGFVANAHDITDRKRAEEALSRMAHYDNLTGLPNRLHVRTQLEMEIEAGHHAVAVLFCDLDGFKEVNDCYGHDFGDEVLRQVAGRWSSELRGSDYLGRWGGDEFVAICSSAGTLDNMTELAERLQRQLVAPLALNGGLVQLGVSIGVVVHEYSETADELLRRADGAMYEAKRLKRERI